MNDLNQDHNNQAMGQAQQHVGLGEQERKTASPVMTPTKAQAEDATFRIVGDAGALFGALAAAQGAFLPITKNRTVTVRPRDKPAYTFDYATLDQVLAACVPALSANGLALLQPFYHGPNGLEIRTILAHSSGARLESVTELPKTENIQGAGSALTYLKRYQVQAILGVSSEEDDDGNAADGNKVEAMSPRSRPAPPPKPAAAPATTPRKPPERPQAASVPPDEPKPQPAPQTQAQPKSEPPPAPTELLATADKLADMKSLFVSLQFKGTPAKECVGILTGKDAGTITNADVEKVCSVLRVALASKWDADRLMLLVRETPEAEAAVQAIEAETAAMGGAS